MKYTERTAVFLWNTEHSAWHFAYISKKRSTLLRARYKTVSRGFGSLPVDVRIGKTSWRTSIFYDGKSGQYILPLKASIRLKEHIAHDDIITVTFSIAIAKPVSRQKYG